MRISSNIFSSFEEKEVIKVNKDYKLIKKVQVIDTKTFDRYKKLSMHEIARKAMFILLFSPVFLVLKISFNVLQMGFDCMSYIYSYWTMAKAFATLDFVKVFEISGTSRIDFFKYIAQDMIFIARAPFFAVAMQIATLITFASPNTARKAIAKIERSWNYGMDLSYDYRHIDDFKKKSLMKALFDTLSRRNKYDVCCYLAPCFQPGSLNDKHVIYPLPIEIKK